MSGPNSHLRLDIYRVFRLPKDASSGDIKKRYLKLSLKFHPDKIQESQKKGNRGPITKAEQLTWNDINDSYQIFTDAILKKQWDKYDNIADNMFQCLCEDCMNYTHYGINGEQIGKGRFIERNSSYLSPISLRWFCTEEQAKKWETANDYTQEVHGYVEAGGPPPPPPPPPNQKRICPGCHLNKIFTAKWVKYNAAGQACCSDYCLSDYLKSQGMNVKSCARCHKIKRENDGGDWTKGDDGLIFCSEEHKREKSGQGMDFGDGSDPLQAEKDTAIAAIDNSLSQDPIIINLELENTNQNWRNDIQNANDPAQITTIKNRVLADIQNKRNAKKGNPPDPLQTLKNTAIAEIDGELLKDPEIKTSELDSSNQNWGTDIQNANDQDQINQIKDNVLADIKQKRQVKSKGGGGGSDKSQNLDNLRQEAINQIQVELAKQPSIAESELTNQNWKADITESQTESAVKNVRDQVLADIKNKRATKEEQNRIKELLIQAKQEENWNNYEKLEAILKQIKELRSSDAYKEKETEILEVESQLQQLNPEKFGETIKNQLDQQLKDNGLNDSNMDKETQEAIEEAKADPTSVEKRAKAEEKIAQNGANNNLNSLVTEIKSKLKKGNLTKKEKEEAIAKILEFIIKDDYRKTAYQKQKQQVDALLAELQGEKSQDNTQNPPLWKKALVPLLITSLLGIMITGLLIWRKKRLKGKSWQK